MATLTVTQRRSSNGCNQRQLDTLRSLGLRRIGHTVEVPDSDQARGMVHAVRHLVELQVPRKAEPKKADFTKKADPKKTPASAKATEESSK
jgi:large subunit ribosomal protein L30